MLCVLCYVRMYVCLFMYLSYACDDCAVCMYFTYVRVVHACCVCVYVCILYVMVCERVKLCMRVMCVHYVCAYVCV